MQTEGDRQAASLIAAIDSLLGLEEILDAVTIRTKRPFTALLNGHVMLIEEIGFCLCLLVCLIFSFAESWFEALLSSVMRTFYHNCKVVIE